ncbi:hypothetical protein C7S15_5140 [Burkholderia cepacia]|nr:hypothetical protein [Burkholderia cepacia]
MRCNKKQLCRRSGTPIACELFLQRHCARFGGETARTAVQQGFRGSGKSGPPRPRLASKRAGRANSRFR